jgi:hypothetical protein
VLSAILLRSDGAATALPREMRAVTSSGQVTYPQAKKDLEFSTQAK